VADRILVPVSGYTIICFTDRFLSSFREMNPVYSRMVMCSDEGIEEYGCIKQIRGYLSDASAS
jgi:hypothetical protein